MLFMRNIDAVEDEMDAIKRIESELIALIDSLEEDSAIEMAEQLEREIDDFKNRG